MGTTGTRSAYYWAQALAATDIGVVPLASSFGEQCGVRLAGRAPDRVIVLGDLHLGAGSPGGVPDPLECFFHDQKLGTLLGRVGRLWSRRGLHGSLVLNGDAFDFVRVARLPAGAADLRGWTDLLAAAGVEAPAELLATMSAGRFTPVQRRYGLDTSEAESIWKLWSIADGHPHVIAALAQWCGQGHELVVVRGNHDAEWAWPGVRRAFRALLRPGAGSTPGGRVRFRMHSYRRANLHIEHGHAVRWTTASPGRFTGGRHRTLKQPFGSLLNRYVLNPVERLAQRASDVPSARHLKHLLRNQPLHLTRRLLVNAVRDVPAFGRATWGIWHRRARRWWPTRLGEAVGLALLLAPLIAPGLLAMLSLQSISARTAAALLALATPHLGLALLEVVAAVRDDTARRARQLAARLGARLLPQGPPGDRIVVLGHTHRPELIATGDGAGRLVYVNPGCWLGEDERARGQPHIVWCARTGQVYRRTRLLQLDGAAAGCHTRWKS